MTRKRSGYKGTKNGPNLVGTSKSTWEATPHHFGYNMDRVEKGRSGWSKAQSPARRRPNSKYSKSSENVLASSAQLARSTDGLPLIPRLSTSVLSPTLKSNPPSRQLPVSAKGKKNLARFKTSESIHKNTASPQTKQCSLNSPFSFTNLATLSDHASKPSSSVTFEFKTLARDEMGLTTRGGSDRDTGKLQSQVQGS